MLVIVNALELPSSQKFPLLPDSVRQKCFHKDAGAPPVQVGYPAICVAPLNTAASRLLLLGAISTNMLSPAEPVPKSKILLADRVTDGDIQNQLQIENSFGRVNEGSVKNWLLLGEVLALPVKNALFELAPNGPDA